MSYRPPPEAGLPRLLQSWRSMHLIWGAEMQLAHDLPPELKAKLADATNRLTLLRVMWTIFENWPVALHLLQELCYRVFGYTFLEMFSIWRGPGRNGKGLIVKILENLLGGYYQAADMSIVTTSCDPNRPNPDWLRFPGSRVVAVTEAEGAARLKSSVVKLLRDPSTRLAMRGLRENMTRWSPTFGLYLFTNVPLSFTSVDGGLESTTCVTDFPFTFTAHCTEPHHRLADPLLKDDESMVRKLAIEMLYVLMELKRVLVPEDAGFRPQDSVVRPRPFQVAESTRGFLRPLGSGREEDFVQQQLETVSCATLADTEARVVDAFMESGGYPRSVSGKREAAEALMKVLFRVHGVGGRKLLRRRGADSGFVRLRSNDRAAASANTEGL